MSRLPEWLGVATPCQGAMKRVRRKARCGATWAEHAKSVCLAIEIIASYLAEVCFHPSSCHGQQVRHLRGQSGIVHPTLVRPRAQHLEYHNASNDFTWCEGNMTTLSQYCMTPCVIRVANRAAFRHLSFKSPSELPKRVLAQSRQRGDAQALPCRGYHCSTVPFLSQHTCAA